MNVFSLHKSPSIYSYFPVKESVEKNLLSDIGLAIHSGISLDELLGDLTGTGKSIYELRHVISNNVVF